MLGMNGTAAANVTGNDNQMLQSMNPQEARVNAESKMDKSSG